jgi:hypothetical protein
MLGRIALQKKRLPFRSGSLGYFTKYLCSADFFERDERYYLPFAAFLAGFLAFLAMVFSVFRICP